MTVLKKGDTFIDVGANIGYISAIAMDLVGPQGQVHAFEPVKQYFRELKKLKILNKNYQLYLNNVAVGKSDGQHKMHCTKPPFLGGSTIVNGFLPKETPQETQVVKIMRLDTYIRKNNIKKIKLIKIDVEGYEYSVLQGFVDQLFLLKKKPIIICEISPSAYVKIDYSLKQLKKYMSDHGYVAKSILNPKVIIDIENLKDTQDVLFMSNSHN
jgi:FkbM family methyltransferase